MNNHSPLWWHLEPKENNHASCGIIESYSKQNVTYVYNTNIDYNIVIGKEQIRLQLW